MYIPFFNLDPFVMVDLSGDSFTSFSCFSIWSFSLSSQMIDELHLWGNKIDLTGKLISEIRTRYNTFWTRWGIKVKHEKQLIWMQQIHKVISSFKGAYSNPYIDMFYIQIHTNFILLGCLTTLTTLDDLALSVLKYTQIRLL